MQKIKLRFLGTGYNNCNQVHVRIYDMCNRKVVDKWSYNGSINVCLKRCEYYKIIAILNNKIINTIIYTNKCFYEFAFYNCCNNQVNQITFSLTDYYYSDLPIERGNLILNG